MPCAFATDLGLTTLLLGQLQVRLGKRRPEPLPAAVRGADGCRLAAELPLYLPSRVLRIACVCVAGGFAELAAS